MGIAPFGTGAPGSTLYCLPYAGGSAGAFRGWRSRLTAMEVVALEYPGRGRRLAHSPATTMDALVESVIGEVVDGGRRFALFGHSLGALVAFEICQRLRKEGRTLPSHLVVSASPPPHRIADVRQDTRDDSDVWLIEELRRLGGTPDAALRNPDLMSVVLPALRADLAVWGSYAHHECDPLDLEIFAIAGSDDVNASVAEMQGWSRYATRGFGQAVIRGGHVFLSESEEGVSRVVVDALRGAR